MHEKFIARQPIFDKRLRVHAYELLFRSGPQNFFQPRNHASASVIADSLTLFDLQVLTGPARAFVNVDEMALRLGAPRLLPPDRIVVEILESVKPSSEIVESLPRTPSGRLPPGPRRFLGDPSLPAPRRTRPTPESGFQADRFRWPQGHCRTVPGSSIALIAEKVETEAELHEARNLGFCYFQGYFFCKPSMIETREIPGNKFIQLQLLSAVAAPGTRLSSHRRASEARAFPALSPAALSQLPRAGLALRSAHHSSRAHAAG